VDDPPGEVDPEYQDMADDWGSNQEEEEGGESSDSRDVPESGIEQREEGHFVSAPPNPDEDIDHFMNDEKGSEDIADANSGPGGGFSVHRNLETYDEKQDDVWIVGATSVEFSADGGIEKDDVAEFYEEYLSVLEETPACRIGGYHFENGEKISIDLSIALTDKEEAESLGQELNQESVFNPAVALGDGDWENGSIDTGGDGDSPLETPEDVLQTIDNVQALAKTILSAIRMAVGDTMNKDDGLDPDQEFQNDTGRTLTRMKMFRMGWKEGIPLESTDEGYLLDGELFRPVE